MMILSQVEDIVDTGSTLFNLIALLKSKGVSSVSVCTFLDKPARRKVHFEPVGDGKYYLGFEVCSLSLHMYVHSIERINHVLIYHYRNT